MLCPGRAAIFALALLVVMPVFAEGPARPPHSAASVAHKCLDQKERQVANESGKLVPLASAMHSAKSRMPGSVVRARLCRGKDGLVYVLTVLARDGKVARLTVDAVKGTVVGSR